jgi:hypothetical protein
MTTLTVARPRVATPPPAAVRSLARIEAGRMLRSPALWAGTALSVVFAIGSYDQTWASAVYEGLLVATSPMLLGVSVASAYSFGREHVAVADDAPMSATHRSLARLLGGLAPVAVVAAVVAATAAWLQLTGGMPFGDEPGRTAHAQYTLPELLQPVLLAGFGVALGAAVVHLVRSRLVASILLFVWWFMTGAMYWIFNGDVVRWLAPLQVQPLYVEVGSPATDPLSFPASWILSTPGEYQDHWARLVVSPGVAAWHDVYVVALMLLALAVALPGRLRRVLLVSGVALGAVAVLAQAWVAP